MKRILLPWLLGGTLLVASMFVGRWVGQGLRPTITPLILSAVGLGDQCWVDVPSGRTACCEDAHGRRVPKSACGVQ